MNRRVKIGKLSRSGTGIYPTATGLPYTLPMTPHDDQASHPPGRMTLIAAMLGMLLLGVLMLLQGSGLYDAQWLRPNPHAPRWLFATLGTILVLSATLTAGRLRPMPSRLIKTVGYTTLGLSWIIAHWLVFFSEGGSCEAEAGRLLLELPTLACRASMGAMMLALDLILVLVLYATLRPSRRV